MIHTPIPPHQAVNALPAHQPDTFGHVDGFDDLRVACDRDLKWYRSLEALAEHCRANIAERRREASERSRRGWATRRGASC
jgi:hypothetical protein